MIGLRKVISSHPLMSGVANRVHAVSAVRAQAPFGTQPHGGTDGLLERSPMRTVTLVAVVDRPHDAAASPSSMFRSKGAGQPQPRLHRAQ